jgi:hypothetical protein
MAINLHQLPIRQISMEGLALLRGEAEEGGIEQHAGARSWQLRRMNSVRLTPSVAVA